MYADSPDFWFNYWLMMDKISVLFQVVLLFQKVTAASLVPIKHEVKGGWNSAIFKPSFPLWKHSRYTLLCHHLLSPLQSLSIGVLTVTSLLSIAKSYLPWSSSLLPFVLGIHLFYHQTRHFLLCMLLHAIVDFCYSAQIFLPGSTTNIQYLVFYVFERFLMAQAMPYSILPWYR